MIKLNLQKRGFNCTHFLNNFSNYGATESSSAAINHSSRDQDPRSPSTHQVFDKILSEQDQGLDNLHNVVVRSRIAAQNIHSEVGVQNEIIDGLGIIKFH